MLKKTIKKADGVSPTTMRVPDKGTLSMEDKTMETKEQLMEEIRRLQDENQDKFIDELAERISYLCEKANRKSYEPTVHEKQVFSQIVTIIDNMKEWF